MWIRQRSFRELSPINIALGGRGHDSELVLADNKWTRRAHALDAPLIDGVVFAIGLNVWVFGPGLGGFDITESVVGVRAAKPRKNFADF